MLLARYGLAALFLGAGVEGEAVVVSGGLLAHHGAFPLPAAMAAAAAGSCIVDQLWFFAGRHFRNHRWVARARAKPAFARALGVLERHPRWFIFGFRWVYGFRTVSPIAIGTSGIPARTFVPINIAAAIVWACTFTLVGYLAGHAFERLMGRYRPSGQALAIGIAVGVAVLILAGLVHWRRTRRPAGTTTDML